MEENKKIIKTYKEKIRFIKKHNKHYYSEDKPRITDAEYDNFKKEILALEEERRLAYVGITRAKKEAYLSFAMKRAYHGDWMDALPSRFINEIPEDSVEKNDVGITETNDFEFNQDNSIEYEEGYRSPGWDRYKKNKVLKWKK